MTTFIDQAQLNDIDECMELMRNGSAHASEFLDAIEKGGRYPKAAAPYSDIREGEKQAKLWTLGTSIGSYTQSRDLLSEAAVFLRYLVSQIAKLPPARASSSVSALNQIRAPSGRPPMFATAALSNSLQLLRHYQQWIEALTEIRRLTEPRRTGLRAAIAGTLPRLADFMAVQLQISRSEKPQPRRLNTAIGQKKDVDRHYALGMSAVAGFLTQTERITALLDEANMRIAKLLEVSTLWDLSDEILLLEPYLDLALRYLGEMVILRTAR